MYDSVNGVYNGQMVISHRRSINKSNIFIMIILLLYYMAAADVRVYLLNVALNKTIYYLFRDIIQPAINNIRK